MKKLLAFLVLLLVCMGIVWLHIKIWTYGIQHVSKVTFIEENFIDSPE